MQLLDGTLMPRAKGTPQGGVVSLLLANLFLHYTFDKWMRVHHGNVHFERYADDVLVHCKTRRQAEGLLAELRDRFRECGLELHPLKTKIVFCGAKDNLVENIATSFDFLGFTFRKRLAYSAKTKLGFVTFLPAISNSAKKEIRRTIKSWRINLQLGNALEQIAQEINPIVRGWVNYYGKFYQSEMVQLLYQIELYLRRWARRKFAKKTGLASQKRARKYLGRARKYKPYLFEHWRYGLGTPIE